MFTVSRFTLQYGNLEFYVFAEYGGTEIPQNIWLYLHGNYLDGKDNMIFSVKILMEKWENVFSLVMVQMLER